MILDTGPCRIELDDASGAIVSVSNTRREFIHRGCGQRPLCTVRFRDTSGRPTDLHTGMAASTALEPTADGARLRFDGLGDGPVAVAVQVRAPRGSALTYWSVAVEHDLDGYVDWIDFPDVVVPDRLVGSGGDMRLLWPAMEGVIVEDASLRESSWLRYEGVEYRNRGWEGYYPGPCQTQCMACYGPEGGLYLAAHDPLCNVKAIEFHRHDGGIRLEYRLFAGGARRGRYEMRYEMALGVFEGDWHDAASIYRDWLDSSSMLVPPPLAENQRLPAWMGDSPIVVMYPVRGTHDVGDMTPNEYFPYSAALPALERLAEALDSRLLALLMHWEGTAPWAPPYSWPPFGGEESFGAFVEELHAQGHLAGVYCSGIGWTNRSNLVPYSREEQFERERLEAVMVRSPEGALEHSLICNGDAAQRWGHDMCAAHPVVEQIVWEEMRRIASSGVDYVQFFDQNLGGAAYFCYGRRHGHGPAPGRWLVEAMVRLNESIADATERAERPMVIGCEAAAAEPFQRFLPLNDLRFPINLLVGTPVPLYAYLYHERSVNFMGNQCCVAGNIDFERSPDNLCQRIAYSFAAGDLLSVTLRDGGKVHWGWQCGWDVPEPDQAAAVAFLRLLNAWRRGAARPYLGDGRMLKPLPVRGGGQAPLALTHNRGAIPFPAVLSTRWRSRDGREAQVLVNPTSVARGVDVLTAEGASCALVAGPNGERLRRACASGSVHVELPARGVAMLELG